MTAPNSGWLRNGVKEGTGKNGQGHTLGRLLRRAGEVTPEKLLQGSGCQAVGGWPRGPCRKGGSKEKVEEFGLVG